MEFGGLEPKETKDDSHAVSKGLGLQKHQTLCLERPTAQSCVVEIKHVIVT